MQARWLVVAIAALGLGVWSWPAAQAPGRGTAALPRTAPAATGAVPVLRGRTTGPARPVAEPTHRVSEPARLVESEEELAPGREWLAGRVRAHDGTPAAGASVTVRAHGFDDSQAHTDAGGRFRVTVPAKEEFRLRVEAERLGRAARYGLRWAPAVPVEIDLPPTFTVRGRVVRAGRGGAPIGVAGVRVRAYTHEQAYFSGRSAHAGSWAGAGVLTGPDGRFTYPGVTRDGTLRVISDVWYRAGGALEWRRGSQPVLEVLPCTTVSGRVLTDDGRPLEGAVVTGPRQSGSRRRCRALSDGQGRFVLRGLALVCGSYALRAVKGAWRGAREVAVAPGVDVTHAVLCCTRTPSVSGVVVGPGGRPIAQATVRAEWQSGAGGTRETETDHHGRFLLDRLPSPRVALTVHERDFEDLDVGFIEPTMPGTDLGRVALSPSPMLQILVQDVAGAPVLTATVDDRRVDLYGRCGVPPSRREAHSWWVRAPGYVPTQIQHGDLLAGQATVVTLERAHAIEGRVIDVDGSPICGARILAYCGRSIRAYSDLAGRFRIEVPAGARCALDIWDLFHTYPPPITAEADGGEVLIQAVVPSHVAGRVVDGAGCGIPGVRVLAKLEGRPRARTRSATTNEDGAFRIEELAGGSFRLVAYGDVLHARGVRVRDVRGVRPYEADVLMQGEAFGTPHGPHALRGVVTWPDGSPVQGASVEVRRQATVDNWDDDETETDAGGAFSIEGLREGCYAVEAWIALDNDHDTEVMYLCELDDVEAGSSDLQIVLRLVPPEPEDDEAHDSE